MLSKLTPLKEDLTRILESSRVVSDLVELITYECDGLTMSKSLPDLVVYPTSTEEVVGIVKACANRGVPFLARGAGTGLSGGAVATHGGVIIQMSLMNRILRIDLEDEIAVVQPGTVNLHLSDETLSAGYHFAPDPSSQKACTIGGNVAENAGGPHTLKYGVTTNHILGMKVVLPSGELLELGGPFGEATGYDLTGLFVGSEGTFGVITEITVRLIRNPESHRTFLATFDSIEQACNAVSGIISSSIIPAALELMDNLVIRAIESHLKAGFPTEAEAILLIEIDGIETVLEEEEKEIERICRAERAVKVQLTGLEEERQRLWRGRKEAIGALGKITPAFYTNDGVVPRSKLPRILRSDVEIGEKYGLRVAHVCHAGDGNIHPIILYNPDHPKEVEAALRISEEILKECVDLGGALTGEHGIGAEKKEYFHLMFSEDDQSQMMRLWDLFNPESLLNPEKIFPNGSRCGEVGFSRNLSGSGWL
ncbi:MAG: FAD-linked oxidase C-terminal domain-containing protein [Candidatus Neomarinimicrobiota bacterium]